MKTRLLTALMAFALVFSVGIAAADARPAPNKGDGYRNAVKCKIVKCKFR